MGAHHCLRLRGQLGASMAIYSENWRQIASVSGLSEEDLVIRFVEYHRMVEGAGLANPKHYVRCTNNHRGEE